MNGCILHWRAASYSAIQEWRTCTEFIVRVTVSPRELPTDVRCFAPDHAKYSEGVRRSSSKSQGIKTFNFALLFAFAVNTSHPEPRWEPAVMLYLSA